MTDTAAAGAGRTLEVVSVSIGSSTRDTDLLVEVMGRTVHIARRGTNGDLREARAAIAKLDGTVDAIGLGGIDLFLQVRGRRYYLRDAVRLARSARTTPVVCGAGLKDSLERKAVADLDAVRPWSGRKVLLVSGTDRFGMAEALYDSGAEVICGDLIFSLGVDVPLRSSSALVRAARLLLPIISKVPFTWLYPTGSKQDRQPTPSRFDRYYDWAEVIAGDWHLIRKHAPASLAGKVILTNTTTADDVALLRDRGAARLITTTPRFGDRSIGTNLLEAAFVAIDGSGTELSRSRYDELVARADLRPTVLDL